MSNDLLAQKILERDLANLEKRVAEGGRLTAAERVLLQKTAGQDVETPEPEKEVRPGWARSWVELATVLGTTRMQLWRWRRIEGAPQARPNGWISIAEWQAFCAQKQLSSSVPATEGMDNDELKARKLLAEIEDRELRVAIKRGDYVAIEHVATEWTTRVGKAVALLRNKFESELPPVLSGLDAAGIQAECRKAIDEVLAILHNADAEPNN